MPNALGNRSRQVIPPHTLEMEKFEYEALGTAPLV